MLVVDASVLLPALSYDDERGDRARVALGSDQLVAPELIDVEVASALRRRVATDLVTSERAELAVADLVGSDLQRYSHARLLGRAWDLRHSITAYDAVYVALAELLDVPLCTADARLARASGPRCEITLLQD